jgi:hypothetical protein
MPLDGAEVVDLVLYEDIESVSSMGHESRWDGGHSVLIEECPCRDPRKKRKFGNPPHNSSKAMICQSESQFFAKVGELKQKGYLNAAQCKLQANSP